MNLQRIKDIAESKNISIRKLSEILEKTEQGLHSAIRNETLKAGELETIARYMNVPVSYFFGESVTGGNIVQTANGNGNNQNIALQNQCSELQQKVNELNEQLIKCQKELIQHIKKEK